MIFGQSSIPTLGGGRPLSGFQTMYQRLRRRPMGPTPPPEDPNEGERGLYDTPSLPGRGIPFVSMLAQYRRKLAQRRF